MEQDKPSLHSGHRQRLKNRFQTDGLQSFEEHQALELLLFYAIPRRDTNELAHTLLEAFGSMKNLFEADVHDIMNIAGVGENTATLIKLVPDLAAKYWLAEGGTEAEITSIESAATYLRSLLHGKPMEHFYVVCLNASYRVKRAQLLSRGTPTQTPVYIRHITEAALRSGTDKILIGHNHPGGGAEPSKKDVELTLQIMNAMQALQIELVDHIIIASDDYFSFAAQQLISSDFSREDARSAHYSAGLMHNYGNGQF